MRRARTKRRGTTAVEMAMVLPVLLVFVFALIEYGHAQMINNLLTSATRAAARMGSTEGVTTAEIEARVRQVMAPALNTDFVTILVKDASVYDNGGAAPETQEDYENLPDLEADDATPRQLMLVRAVVNYEEIAFIPMSFMDGIVLTGQAITRHE